jgi:hypothetical protein
LHDDANDRSAVRAVSPDWPLPSLHFSAIAPTVYARAAGRERALAADLLYYVVKPVDLDALAKVIWPSFQENSPKAD